MAETLPLEVSNVAVAPANPVPVTVTVVAPDPAGIELGLTPVIAGAELETAPTRSVRMALVPPPGGGFVTNTERFPVTNALAGTTVVIEVGVEVVGEFCSAPMLMIEVPLKLLPLKVSVSGPPEAGVSAGEILIRTGT